MEFSPGILEEINFRSRKKKKKKEGISSKSYSPELEKNITEASSTTTTDMLLSNWRVGVKDWAKSPTSLKFDLTQRMLKESKTIMRDLFNVVNGSVLQRINLMEVKLLFLLLSFEENNSMEYYSEFILKDRRSVNFLEFYTTFMRLHIFEHVFFESEGSIFCRIPSSSIIFESLTSEEIKSLYVRRRGSLESEVRTSVLHKITEKYNHHRSNNKKNQKESFCIVRIDIFLNACKRRVRFLSGKYDRSFVPRNTSASLKGRWIKDFLKERHGK